MTPAPALSQAPLFDHLVGAYQQPGRKFDPERLRRFEVEGQLDFCDLLDRKRRLFTVPQ